MFIKFLETTQETPDTPKIISWEEIWNNIVSWCATSGLKFVISLVAFDVQLIIINHPIFSISALGAECYTVPAPNFFCSNNLVY